MDEWFALTARAGWRVTASHVTLYWCVWRWGVLVVVGERRSAVPCCVVLCCAVFVCLFVDWFGLVSVDGKRGGNTSLIHCCVVAEFLRP